jgi:hypothetical protein
VIGRSRPWATLKQKKICGFSAVEPSGSGNSVVIGRAWVSHSVPSASSAHSVSCGEP